MKMGLLVCTTLSVFVSIAQAAPEPQDTSGPLRLTAPQMDIATAGSMTNPWITSAAIGSQLTQLNRAHQTGANIQLMVRINGLPAGGSFDSSKIVLPSSSGASISVGQTVFEGEMQ